MSTPDPTTPQGRPVMECGVCRIDVPAGDFCGLCGGHLHDHPRNGPEWLRLRAFSAAPREHLLVPNIISTLFPHLPPRSRLPFLLGLVLVLVALTVAVLLKLPAMLITVAALGLPLLFLIYLQEADIHRDIPSGMLVLTSALGIGLGVGWVLLTGAAVARAYGVPLGAGVAGVRILRDGLGVPIASMLLMLLPAALIRLWPRSTRESLDGFAIGALGALMFTGAATLTRLAPQFSVGMVARARPTEGLMVEAGIRGVAVPLTAACVGGLIGTALWFRRPENKRDQHRGSVRITLALMGFSVIALYAAIGLVDIARTPQLVQLAAHLGIALLALLLLRVGLQMALLHERHEAPDQDEPLLCWQCGHVVPDMPFCAACGASVQASSRSSRRFRRQFRPLPQPPEAQQ